MKRRKKTADEESSLDLIERAFHLLRCTPLSLLALYYLGAIPFIVGLLFFLADMAASPFAADRCVGSALGLGLLYIWMRLWQSQFCCRLRDRLALCKPRPVTVRQIFRQIYLHTVYSSWGLILVPLSALMTLPFCWVFAYFNNLCVVDLSSGTVKQAAAKARALAMPWPKQNHLVVSILALFGFFVFLNLITVLSQLPHLLKMLAGVESAFSQSYFWMANSTFFGIVIGLAYLAVDPLVKAVYVLRFHSAESIATGADLLAEVRQLPPRRRVAAGAVRIAVVGVLLLCASFSHGQTVSPRNPPAIQPTELDSAVDRVMKRAEFTWRMPREFVPAEEGNLGFFARFMESVSDWLRKGVEAVGDLLERFARWLRKWSRHTPDKDQSSGGFNPEIIKGFAVFLLILLAGVLAVFLIKVLRARRAHPEIATEAVPVSAVVDLEDENLIATLLEEDEWIALARELAAAGELRKALRAWFFAGMAFLARIDLLVVLQSKSNLDYRRELDRRARRSPAVVPLFGESVVLFERAWYGLHTATAEDLQQMESNLERMRHGVNA